jgi:hypothetical protein
MLRWYYGPGRPPQTKGEIGKRLGVSPQQVSARLGRVVARLLGVNVLAGLPKSGLAAAAAEARS